MPLRRTDLIAAAALLVPEIGIVWARAGGLPGALLARMSSAGASRFPLFRDRATAEEARAALAAAEPSWWCAEGRLLAPAELSD